MRWKGAALATGLTVAGGGALVTELMFDEGTRLTPYRDSMGHMTVGTGHQIVKGDPRGRITPAQNAALLETDIAIAQDRLDTTFPEWRELDPVRQRAMLNLSFNIGYKLGGFKNFLAAMRRQDWNAAGTALRQSRWCRQVGQRCPRIVKMIKEGVR